MAKCKTPGCQTCESVKPYVIPAGMARSCEHPAPTGCFDLNDAERYLFDSFAQEHLGIIGTEVEFWSQRVSKSKRDALYDEPVERVWNGPFKLTGLFQYVDTTSDAREEGLREIGPTEIWIARREFEEKNAPPPDTGDVIRVWNLPIFKFIGQEQGFYFDVTGTSEDGHLFDQASFVGWKLTLNRRTEFTPERRLTPP